MNLSSVYADSFDSLPIGDQTTPDNTMVLYYSNGSPRTFNATRSSVYVFSVGSQSTYTFYFATNINEGFTSYRFDNGVYSNIKYYYATLNDFEYSSNYDLYYSNFINDASVTPSINNYSDVTSALSALRSYLDSPSTPVEQGYTNIENGNIVYFDLGANVSFNIDLESQFYSNSGVISGTWTDDNRRYGFSSELPVADTNFGETAGSGILWTKSTKGQNILGQTKIGDSNITGTTSAKYLWIINPMYNNKYFEDNLDAKALNGLITVTGVPAGTPVYTYKLKQNASSIGLESTIPDVSGGTGTVSDTSGTQTTYVSTDDNETPYTQTVGGDNTAPEEVTATEGIRQTLDQLANSFGNLFLAPVEYIQNLISSGSAFMQTLGGIFSWLPEPVVSVFLSALVLMIVIGVIKMLL